jgi:serine/threonine protein phosphatase 1
MRCVPSFESDNHLFVHANYIAHLPLVDQPERTLYWEHLHERIPGPHHSGKTAWVGHSPQIHGLIADLGHLVCIDTFCFGGMYLTAIDVDSREIWQADKWGNLRGMRSPVLKLVRWLWRQSMGLLARQRKSSKPG